MNHEPVFQKMYAIVTDVKFEAARDRLTVELLTDTGARVYSQAMSQYFSAMMARRFSFGFTSNSAPEFLRDAINVVTRNMYDLHFCE